MKNKLVLVGGGARSGKSRFALHYAHALGERRRFIATAEASDDEMRDRIFRHQEERGHTFTTVEEPVHLAAALRATVDAEVVVVDCLTLWLANLLMRGQSPEEIQSAVEEVITVLASRLFHAILVSNEVGMGIVPTHPLGRAFRDIAGRTHQQLASAADEVYFAALGMMLRLTPSPFLALRPGDTP